MWDVRTVLCCDEKLMCGREASLVATTFAGNKSLKKRKLTMKRAVEITQKRMRSLKGVLLS